jgi:putative cell wall-binding protein
VIIASGEQFPDALSGSGLAGTVNAPILLTEKDTLPDATAKELTRLVPETVYLLGAKAAITDKVATQIKNTPSKPKVIRLGGNDRYETAKKIADEIKAQGGNTQSAYLASGANFADAATLSSFVASQKIPILLTANTGSLNTHTKSYIEDNQVSDIVIAGGTGAVSSKAESALKSAGVKDITRKGGKTRFETCEELSTYLVDKYGLSNKVYLIGVAIGEANKFADALTGGAAIGTRGGVSIITTATDASFVLGLIKKITADNSPTIEIYGLTQAISQAIEDKLEASFPAVPEEEKPEEKPRPAWDDPIFLPIGLGHIEVLSGVNSNGDRYCYYDVFANGGEYRTVEEVMSFYDLYIDTPYYRSQEFYEELFTRCNLYSFNGTYGSTDMKYPDVVFADVFYYLEHYGDGRDCSTMDLDPNEVFCFINFL